MLHRHVFPVPGGTYSDTWGASRSGGRTHEGVDIFASEGTPILAVVDGKITKAGDDGGRGGLRVWINDRYYFAHLSKLTVKAGQTVKAGDTIGYVGTTGDAKGTPPHLHFGERTDGKWVDPFKALQRWQAGTFLPEPEEATPSATGPAPLNLQGPPGAQLLAGPPSPELPGSAEIPYRPPGDDRIELWRAVAQNARSQETLSWYEKAQLLEGR